MLYGDGSKSVTTEELLGPNGDPDFMSEEEADFEDSQFPAVAIDPPTPSPPNPSIVTAKLVPLGSFTTSMCC
jgi:hypothetical protein